MTNHSIWIGLTIGAVALVVWGATRLAKTINDALDDPYFDERNWH